MCSQYKASRQNLQVRLHRTGVMSADALFVHLAVSGFIVYLVLFGFMA